MELVVIISKRHWFLLDSRENYSARCNGCKCGTAFGPAGLETCT